jgi:anti-sigma regulatory factor (Ser/Thr protein kinase)
VSERELHLALPARPENVIVVRQAVAGLGEALGVPTQRVDDLKTVVTEACNNVVLHAYPGAEEGPLEVTASASDDAIEIEVQDQGSGFQPSSGVGDELSLGLGLPLIAALSDSFEISGAAGKGTRMRMRFELAAAAVANGTPHMDAAEELAMQISGPAIVRPVLARVIGALAARAEFSVDRLADTVLIGDAVSAHGADDFASGRLEVVITDGDGTLDVRLGPLVEGGGERILAQMDIPEGGGSLRTLANTMQVTTDTASDGSTAEYVEFEVAG